MIIINSSFTIQKKEDAMSIFVASTENSTTEEWGHTLEFGPNEVIVSITNNFNCKKYQINDEITLIKHILYPDGTKGKIKNISRPSQGGIVTIQFDNGRSALASLDQIVKN